MNKFWHGTSTTVSKRTLPALAWAVDAAVAGVTGLETFRLCLGQLLELLGEEPPVCFCRCEVGGAFESGLRGVSSS